VARAHLKTLEANVEADLEMKRRALESTPSPVKPGPKGRHKPDVLAGLSSYRVERAGTHSTRSIGMTY
jgi:hypothetical protein